MAKAVLVVDMVRSFLEEGYPLSLYIVGLSPLILSLTPMK